MGTIDARRPARERLLDACDELFYGQGIAATGVDAVLHRARVSPATLYAHFGGKDGLVAAYLERRHRRWRLAWDEAVAAAGDHADRLLSVFDALETFRRREGAARGCAVLAASAEVVDPQHPAHAWIEADTALLTTRLEQLARDSGAQQPSALAAELLLVYDGVLSAYARHATHGSMDRTDPLRRGRELARLVVRQHLHA